ncbi:MAG TPA: hypothetical protein PLM75_04315 [bacterium]|nr:hypothetical protein [bacterium]
MYDKTKLTFLFLVFLSLFANCAHKKYTLDPAQKKDFSSIDKLKTILANSPNAVKSRIRCIYIDKENKNTLYGDFEIKQHKIELSLFSAVNYVKIKSIADTFAFLLLVNNQDESAAFGNYEPSKFIKFIKFIFTGSIQSDDLQIINETDNIIELSAFENKIKIIFDKNNKTIKSAQHSNVRIVYDNFKKFGDYILPIKFKILVSDNENPFTLDIAFDKNKLSVN